MSIGLGNGLWPIRHQAVILTDAGSLSIGLREINFSEFLITIQTSSFTKMHLNYHLWNGGHFVHFVIIKLSMMTSSNGKICRVTGHLCGEFTSHRLIPPTKASDTELYIFSWWRHQMETFYALLDICAGNSPVPGEFPAQRPVTRSFDVFFDLRLNKRLRKQSWGWWFETLTCPFWRHCNVWFAPE